MLAYPGRVLSADRLARDPENAGQPFLRPGAIGYRHTYDQHVAVCLHEGF